jgi:transcriptional regulator with XRE-family HTH domain
MEVKVPDRLIRLAGEMLTAERKRAGLSQVVLAKKLKRSQTFVARFERGARPLDLSEFVQACTVLGCDPGRMFRALLAGDD